MKNLMLPKVSSKGRKEKKKGQRKQAEDTKVTRSGSPDAAHEFWTNILPGNQDGHSPGNKAALE